MVVPVDVCVVEVGVLVVVGEVVVVAGLFCAFFVPLPLASFLSSFYKPLCNPPLSRRCAVRAHVLTSTLVLMMLCGYQQVSAVSE